MTNPTIAVPRELLERLEHVTRNLAPHLKCHADLTALLTEQPHASAAQSAPAGEREALERELLSVLDFSDSNLRRVVDRLLEVGYSRAAPRQPEGEEIAWSLRSDVAGCGLVRYMTDRKYQAQTPAIKQWYEPFRCQQCSDAQRVIAKLTDRNTKLCATINRMVAEGVLICDERDTLRQQLAERDAEIERLRVKLMTIASAEPGRHNIEWAKAMAATGNNEAYAKWREAFDQRDKLADILRDLVPGCKWRFMRPRIDAALAEIDHGNE